MSTSDHVVIYLFSLCWRERREIQAVVHNNFKFFIDNSFWLFWKSPRRVTGCININIIYTSCAVGIKSFCYSNWEFNSSLREDLKNTVYSESHHVKQNSNNKLLEPGPWQYYCCVTWSAIWPPDGSTWPADFLQVCGLEKSTTYTKLEHFFLL